MPKNWKNLIRAIMLLFTGISAIWFTQKAIQSQNNEKTENNLQKLKTTLLLSAGANGEGKVNLLGQKRNLDFIRKQINQEPHEIQFTSRASQTKKQEPWEKTPFPPLLVVKTNKNLGTLTLVGDLHTEKTVIHLTGQEEQVNIHPTYNWQTPTNETEELLQLSFQNLQGDTIKQDILIEWSEPNEIFLSDNCLPHLAALIDTRANPVIRADIKNTNPSQDEIIKWIKQTARSLEPYKIQYEEIPEESIQDLGWQKIRTPQKILQERKGNCLDLSIFWAGMILKQDLQAWIIIVPEHALVAIGPKGSGPEKAIALETTLLTGENLKANSVERAIETGHERIREELAKSNQDVTIIDINYWKKFFEPY